MPNRPYILLVPRSGTEGIGESTRALILARAASQRWPGARIELVTSMADTWLEGRGFAHHLVAGGASRNAEAMNDLLRRIRPDVAIFDGWGRTGTLALAVELGVRTVFIAATNLALRRLFGSRRLRFVDQIWIVESHFGAEGPLLTRRRRFWLTLARRSQAYIVDAIFPEPDSSRGRELRLRLGLGEEPYVLFCAGGGGTEHGARPVPEVFCEAAGRVGEELGVATVAVQGPLYAGREPAPPGVVVLQRLEPEEMIDLIAGAQVVACGGGDIVTQTLANERPCVVACTGGADQPERIRAFTEAGLVEASPLDACALADRVIGLLRDAVHRRALRQRAAECGLRNGMVDSLDRLGRLLESPA